MDRNSSGGRIFKNTWLVQQYGTYQKYVSAIQSQIDELNKTILIAQNSLDANEPDMKYVPGGSRNRTVSFLDYSVFVALLAVLLGGWLMASEFQQGNNQVAADPAKNPCENIDGQIYISLVDMSRHLYNRKHS